MMLWTKHNRSHASKLHLPATHAFFFPISVCSSFQDEWLWWFSHFQKQFFSSKVNILDWTCSGVEYMFLGCPTSLKRHPKSLVYMGSGGFHMSMNCYFEFDLVLFLPCFLLQHCELITFGQHLLTKVWETFKQYQNLFSLFLQRL